MRVKDDGGLSALRSLSAGGLGVYPITIPGGWAAQLC